MKYSCIGLFKHSYDDPNRTPKFEERVVIAEAPSLDEVEKIFLSEFMEYSSYGIQFLNEYEIAEIIEEVNNKVIEVASSMKTFDGTQDEYLNKHWSDPKPISCDNVGWKHVWYKHDAENSHCYNCQEERKRSC